MKALFIPLKTEHYEAFVSGVKKTEYRLYGPRWNEKTCPVGREAVISKGYGLKNRKRGKVLAFRNVGAVYSLGWEDLKKCYLNIAKETRIAEIDIQLEAENV